MAVALRVLVLALALGGWSTAAKAQPTAEISAALREGNQAAMAGDWAAVAGRIAPLLAPERRGALASPELAEAHRLAGLAAFFAQRRAEAEAHFLSYLRIDLDGRLDPALYPPDVVAFFGDVASRHAAELRARRARPQRSWALNLIPPAGQLQNGETRKAFVFGGALGVLLVTNVTTYLVLRNWCDQTQGPAGGAASCDRGGDHHRAASVLRPINLASGVGLVLTYALGVYDGVQGYRRRSQELVIQPFITVGAAGSQFGITARF